MSTQEPNRKPPAPLEPDDELPIYSAVVAEIWPPDIRMNATRTRPRRRPEAPR